MQIISRHRFVYWLKHVQVIIWHTSGQFDTEIRRDRNTFKLRTFKIRANEIVWQNVFQDGIIWKVLFQMLIQTRKIEKHLNALNSRRVYKFTVQSLTRCIYHRFIPFAIRENSRQPAKVTLVSTIHCTIVLYTIGFISDDSTRSDFPLHNPPLLKHPFFFSL